VAEPERECSHLEIAGVSAEDQLLYNKLKPPAVSRAAAIPAPGPQAALSGELITPVVRYGGRLVVDVSPDYLRGLFKDHTSIQAQKLVAAYLGKWMRTSGRLGDVLRQQLEHQVGVDDKA
jgi:hypothetical protein